MAQTRPSEFDVFGDLLPARGKSRRLVVATGEEVPVTSPALELQRALDEMFTSTPMRGFDHRRGVIRTAATMAMIATCSAFWWAAARWGVSLIAAQLT
jgi:hypothetical protein